MAGLVGTTPSANLFVGANPMGGGFAVTNPFESLAATSQKTMPSVVTDPTDAVVQLIAKLDKGEVGLVQTADCIEAAPSKAGFVHNMDIAPRQVGLDPVNRDGEGGTPSRF